MPLAETFLSIRAPDGEVDRAALDALLAARLAEARARWPGVTLDDDAFVTHLATVAPPGGDPCKAIGELVTSELYLACACARDAPGGVAAFDQHYLSRLPALLAGLRLDRAGLDDARQLVSQRLLLPRPDGRPRIADYTGRGSLEGWLRIAALRVVINERKRVKPHASIDADGADRRLLPSQVGPELALFRARHRDDLAAALRTAMAALGDRERTLLRLHFLNGVPTVELGPMYGVHRTTVGRWIEAAQEALFTGTRRALMERLEVTESECGSLIRALQSQLDLTFSMLDEPPAQAEG